MEHKGLGSATKDRVRACFSSNNTGAWHWGKEEREACGSLEGETPHRGEAGEQQPPESRNSRNAG